MQNLDPIIVVLLGMSMLGVLLRPAAAAHPSSASIRPDLEYLNAVNQAAPARDPQLLFLLMGEYASANRGDIGKSCAEPASYKNKTKEKERKR